MTGISNAIAPRLGIKAMTVAVLSENFFSAIFETCGRFPRCFCDIIAFPFNEVLISSAPFPVVKDRFDFVAFFIVVDVWWRSREVGTVDFGFGVRHE